MVYYNEFDEPTAWWLMGFPTEFSNIVDMVMPLFRK